MQNPMTSQNTLPFDLTVISLAAWLEELSLLPPLQAARRLSEALKQIKTENSENAALLPLLINLTPLTLHLAHNLSSSASTDTKPLEKTLKIGKLSMQLPKQLALLFCRLAESQLLDAGALTTALYYALQLIGHSLRCYSLFYDIPSASLWKKSADLYRLAATNQCLTSNQASKLAEFKLQGSIESVLKRNLLFSILNPNLYKTDEIGRLFQLASQSADLLAISTGQDLHHFGFYWEMDKDIPPCPVPKNLRVLPRDFMAIDSQAIGHALQSNSISSDLAPAIQNKLTLILSGYHQVFGSIIPGLPASYKLIDGFAKIGGYLYELNKLSKINQLGSQLCDTQDGLENLSLVPLEHQRNVFQITNQPFTKQQSIGIAVNILQTPNSKYLVAESRFLNCSTGDIALIYKAQHPVSLTIIRQQRFNDISNMHQFLLELIPGPCTLFNVTNSAEDEYAIVVGEKGSNPQVFLAGGKHSVNGKLSLNIDKSLHLLACLENNGFFQRFKFGFTD